MTTPNHLGGHFNFTAMVESTFDFIKEKYNIQSVIDIGCGPAGMVEYMRSKGVDAIGIDGDPELPKKDYVIVHDYTLGPLELDKKFDLAYSTEFLEHVYEEFIPNFLPSFQKAKYVFCSAAPEGQGGHHHVNENSKEYWIEKFDSYGFTYLKEDSDEISKTHDYKLVKDNSMFFVNRNYE
jgi:cyclopropane fatty-acyl-phospholipid synthase-like methyltransferase